MLDAGLNKFSASLGFLFFSLHGGLVGFGGKQVSDKKPDLHSPCFLFFLFKSQAPLGQDSSCKIRNRKNRKQAKIK